jgi:hypothetical protein
MSNVDQSPQPEPALDELEAALREDVRSLASPIDPDFQDRLRARFAGASAADQEVARETPRRRLTLGLLRDPRLAGGLATVLAILVAAVVIAAPFSHEAHPRIGRSLDAQGTSGSVAAAGGAESKFDALAPVPSSAPASPTRASGRVQELGASISLASTPSQIQSVADGVSSLTVSDGGYVQHSHVEVAGKASEATLELSVPSAKLTSILAALGRLAPVSAESQSLQDITGAHAAAKRRLTDVLTERAALLRALAHASTQGEIESLHRRLALVGGGIARAQTVLAGLSRRANNSSIEVTVLSDGHTAGEGLTLHRGLHDAEQVLSVALICLLIGLSGLVPALLVLAVAVAALRRGRRAMRERALL